LGVKISGSLCNSCSSDWSVVSDNWTTNSYWVLFINNWGMGVLNLMSWMCD
jgi:hypothetical protein